MAMVTCPGCLERDQRIAALERRVAELEALVRDRNARLGTNATNSGTPPSANPPGAPKPVTKAPTGKKPGGQPGHPPRLKRRLPPQRLHKVIPFVPSHCDRCHEPLPPHPAPGSLHAMLSGGGTLAPEHHDHGSEIRELLRIVQKSGVASIVRHTRSRWRVDMRSTSR